MIFIALFTRPLFGGRPQHGVFRRYILELGIFLVPPEEGQGQFDARRVLGRTSDRIDIFSHGYGRVVMGQAGDEPKAEVNGFFHQGIIRRGVADLCQIGSGFEFEIRLWLLFRDNHRFRLLAVDFYTWPVSGG